MKFLDKISTNSTLVVQGARGHTETRFFGAKPNRARQQAKLITHEAALQAKRGICFQRAKKGFMRSTDTVICGKYKSIYS